MGDPSKPGLYMILLKIASNTKIVAHLHPDQRGKHEQIDPILLVDSQSARWGQCNQNLQFNIKIPQVWKHMGVLIYAILRF